MEKIQELPVCDRPRERLIAFGAGALSDVELLSVMLGRGCRGKDVQALAIDVLHVIDNSVEDCCFKELSKIGGIGAAKATQIVAGIEFSRRRIRPEGLKIKTPADILPILSRYVDKKQEHFIVVSVNGAHEVIATRCVSVGLLDSTLIHPREVFADAIVDRAGAVILAHNHPSGSLEVSEQDLTTTRKLIEAGKIIGIKILDHIVLSKRGYVSLMEEGLVAF